MIEIGIGLLIIAIGSFGQSSSYVPINKIRDWSWESFWLVQGIFAWLVFPYLGAMLAVPEGSTLLELWCSPGSLGAVIYGMLWGVGGLTFGLSMRYLGVALGQSIALGTCAGFGTLFPALFGGTNLFEGTMGRRGKRRTSVFARGENLGAGAIHLPRACEGHRVPKTPCVLGAPTR